LKRYVNDTFDFGVFTASQAEIIAFLFFIGIAGFMIVFKKPLHKVQV
jgi:hypothetical protein